MANLNKVLLMGNLTRDPELRYAPNGTAVTTFTIAMGRVFNSASGEKKEDVCYSFQETIFAMMVEVTERALAHTEKKEVLLTGGVAQSKRLQKMMTDMCDGHNAKFYAPPGSLCGDNGAMIAWTGIIAKNKEEIEAKPRWRTDEVDW